MRKILKVLLIICLVVVVRMFICKQFPFQKDTPGECAAMSDIDIDMETAIISTLREHANTEDAGQLFDTGIEMSSREFSSLRFMLDHMFLGEKKVCVWLNKNGHRIVFIRDVNGNAKSGYSFGIESYGTMNRKNHVYVGFFPDSDPEELFKQHDTAYKILSSAVYDSPDDDRDFYEYCRDFLTKDTRLGDTYELVTHSPYGLLVNKEAVCEAYSSAFAYMCWLKDKECLHILTDNFTHSICAVPIEGTWYTVDLTASSNKIHKAQGDMLKRIKRYAGK